MSSVSKFSGIVVPTSVWRSVLGFAGAVTCAVYCQSVAAQDSLGNLAPAPVVEPAAAPVAPVEAPAIPSDPDASKGSAEIGAPSSPRVSPSGAELGATKTVPVVTVTLFRRDDGSGNPGVAVAQFAPSDRSQHFEVGVKGLEAESGPFLVRWDFEALETSVSKIKHIASSEQRFPVSVESKEVLLNGKVSLPRDWPIGRYRATVSVNGQPLRMLDYVVGPDAPVAPAIPPVTGVKMFSDDGRGKPDQQRLQFIPGDRKIHFRADLGAKFTGKARWRFTAVTTAAGNNVNLLDLQGDVKEVDFLVSQMSAPQDWPVGVYRAELFLNDTLAHTNDFTISRG